MEFTYLMCYCVNRNIKVSYSFVKAFNISHSTLCESMHTCIFTNVCLLSKHFQYTNVNSQPDNTIVTCLTLVFFLSRPIIIIEINFKNK